ncbi:molybdopterin dehydrogenase [Falsiroseomonas bella]|uniref:Molybdopterin dehydrogenase n=1 Tax=Falsiroseomonas bella TaxID=2184016 RepID=A0A317FDW6_9PROT|nr:xanthine dehydrogenase family protein subunit M [Falsiroseomonas bella]PWS36129.1 molybdopterin dehydrogenase [Falsiroseomonas bella]
MKPAPFDWHAPESVAEALALKARHGEDARFLAGGQSLVPAMNFRIAQPAVLVDLNRVAGLDAIAVGADGSLTIGAMARNAAIERHAGAVKSHPILAEALHEVAHPQVRNRGTLGGNLSHADPASEMPAVMLALAARFLIRSARGERQVAAAEFFLGPLTTALELDEMLAEIRLPPLPPRSGTAWLEIARRRGEYAMMGVAAVVTRDAAGICTAVRLACCSAGPTPMAAPKAAASLVGTKLTDADLAQAAALLKQEIAPTGSVQASPAYQRHLAGVIAARALATAWERAA